MCIVIGLSEIDFCMVCTILIEFFFFILVDNLTRCMKFKHNFVTVSNHSKCLLIIPQRLQINVLFLINI